MREKRREPLSWMSCPQMGYTTKKATRYEGGIPMSDSGKSPLVGLMIVAAGSIFGCDKPPAAREQSASKPTVIEEIAVSGFDREGEPVVKKWSDGSISIHFQAMPPFFAEEEGTESDFENFETTLQDALGVPVRRDDREGFIIMSPKPDTAQKAKAWLEAYRKKP